MNSKYNFADSDKIYFISFDVPNQIDLFIREAYRKEILKSVRYCREEKGLELSITKYNERFETAYIRMLPKCTENN